MDDTSLLPPLVDQSFSQEEESFPLVDNAPGTNLAPQQDPEDIAARAAKYDFALGENSPGVDGIYSRIQSNLEDADRRKLSLDKTLERSRIRTGLIDELSNRAASEGRTFNEQEAQSVLNLSNLAIDSVSQPGLPNVTGSLVVEPETVFEREFAEKVIGSAFETGEDTPFFDAASQDYEGSQSKLDALARSMVFKESYQKLAEEMDALVKEQGTVPYIADFAKGMVPWYTSLKIRNVVGNDSPIYGLTGNNMQDNIDNAYIGSPELTVPQVRKAVKELAKDNPQLAAVFAHNLVSYSSGWKNFDNIMGFIGDIALPLGSPALKLAKGASKAVVTGAKAAANADVKAIQEAAANSGQRLNKVIKDVASTVMRKDATTVEVLDAAGKVEASALTSILEKIAQQYAAGGANILKAKDLVNELPGIFNAFEVSGGIRSTWATAMTSRTMEELLSDASIGMRRLFNDPFKSAKYGPSAIAAAKDAAARTFRIERRDLENSIMNVFEQPLEDGLGAHQALIHIGDHQALPFESLELATNFAKIHGLEARQIPAGSGWVNQLQRPMDFSLDTVREAMKADVKADATPWSNILGRTLTKYRSGEDTMPRQVVEAMKRATYGSSGLEKMIMTSAKRIGGLRGDSRTRFDSFIKSEQLERNVLNPEKLGAMSKDPAEFDTKWFSRYNRNPTAGERDAYFTYRFINDMHYAGLNLGLWLDKNAIGLQNIRVNGLPSVFEGKVTTFDRLKGVQSNASVMVIEEGVDPWFTSSKFWKGKPREGMDKNDLENITRMVEQEGYVIHQVSDIGHLNIKEMLPAGALGKARVNFVIAKGTKAEALPLRQVPYQPGIHNVTPDGYFISQADLYSNAASKTTTYYGDRNLFYVADQKMAKDFASKFEEFRKLYKEAKSTSKKTNPLERAQAIEKAKAYAKKELPVTFRQLQKDFGKKGMLDIDSPILFRASNQSLADAHPLQNFFKDTNFVKHADDELNLYKGRVNLEFATKKGDQIREIVNRGDQVAPVYGMRAAPLMDPMAALDRGVSAMLRGRHFEPVKVQIADKFIAEFGDLLEETSKKALADPFRVIHDFDKLVRTNIRGEDLERVRQAKSYAARARQFFGTINSPESLWWKQQGEKLMSTLGPEYKGGWTESLAKILSEGNPDQQLRKLAFYPKLGFWNPKQLLQQANTALNVVALSPKHGIQGVYYSMWTRAAMLDEKLVPAIAAKIDAHPMTKALGMSGKEFTEIIETMERSGFGRMGREVATREQHLEGRVVQTKLGAIMDNGLFFMKEGEEFVRRAAWATAYRETKAGKVGAKMTDSDLSKVLSRADLMNVNMSHASNASWQQGMASVPTQFWSYQIRMMEQMTGKRLTWQEKARLFGMYSLFYGIPVGSTLGVAVWPVHESVKEYLISKDIDADTNVIAQTLEFNLMNQFGHMIGLGDSNLNTVYGSSGIPILKEFMDGNLGVYEAATGASGNVFSNVLAAAIGPVWDKLAAVFTGREAYELQTSDFTNVLTSSISSLNTVEKMYVAMTTQKYLSKYGQTIATDDSMYRQLMHALLGTNPKAIDDMYRMMQEDKNYENYIKKLNRWVQEDIRDALNSNDPADADAKWKRAQVKAQWYPREDQKQKAFMSVLQDNKSLLERARQQHAKRSLDALDYTIRQREKDGVK